MSASSPMGGSSAHDQRGLTSDEITASRARERRTRALLVGGIFGAVVLIAVLALAVYFLLQPGTPTDRIRDVFIVIVSLETLVIGVALVILLIQIASLINLLQNEVRPILQATSETINTLRGTADFLGESVVEPILKLNGYLASLQRMLELMGIKRR